MAGTVAYPKENRKGCCRFDESGILFKSKPGALLTFSAASSPSPSSVLDVGEHLGVANAAAVAPLVVAGDPSEGGFGVGLGSDDVGDGAIAEGLVVFLEDFFGCIRGGSDGGDDGTELESHDFLGLNRKDLPKMAKDKSKDVCIDSVGRVQWPRSSNASLAPLFIPLEATKQAKSGYDPISTGFLPILTGYAFGSHSKPPCLPKNNTWTLPILDKTTSASSSNFSFNNENLAAASMEQQSLRGISIGKPPSTFTKNRFDLGTSQFKE
ncbi:hypothetical protein F0562_004128 [Nyssa sinensis]|uniref:Uncharacterized protein n=1 Tax=Nyssa sinensis TaxID=561372 RepID=A0A5J5BXR1_9ASTE|nr:hypothetical protein F0562_004128 [Nyssa sinensis]